MQALLDAGFFVPPELRHKTNMMEASSTIGLPLC